MTALCSGKICTIFPEKGALNFWKACTIALEYSVDLIEAINAAIIEDIDKDDSNLYWELFERALINYSNSKATSNSMEELCEKALLEN